MTKKTYRDSFTDRKIVDEYLDRYSGTTLSSYLFEIEKQVLSDVIGNEINSTYGGEVKYLDYACGTGRILSFFTERCSGEKFTLDAVGMDISEEMLATIKETPARLVHIDISTDLIPEEKFDIITCFRFFLNSEESLRVSVLEQLHKILNRDGFLIVNNHGSCSSFLGLLRFFNKDTHCLSDAKFLDVLSKNGFEVKSVYGYGLLPGIIVNRKALRSLLLKIEKFLSINKLGGLICKFGVVKLYVLKKSQK